MARGNSNALPSKVKVVDPPQHAKILGVSKLSEETVQSAVKPNVPVLSSVCELLECPVCSNTMYPPIHQCFNGHPVCSGCKPRMQGRCPTCREELGNIRCLTLEKVAASLELPCEYQKSGCSGVFPYCRKLKHESRCSFRPYKCPLASSKCSILGDIPFLISHLKNYHKVYMEKGNTFNERYVKSSSLEVKNATWTTTVYSCFGQYFCLHFEAFQPGVVPVYIAFLRLMGDYKEAIKYSYRLEFGGKGGKKIWEGVPRSVRDSKLEVRDSLDGLIIQQNIFYGEDGKKLELRVTGKVWKRQ